MRDYVVCDMNYGPIKKDHDYKVVEEGYDWLRLKCGGSTVYIPRSLVSYNYSRTNKTAPSYQLPTYAEIVEEDFA